MYSGDNEFQVLESVQPFSYEQKKIPQNNHLTQMTKPSLTK